MDYLNDQRSNSWIYTSTCMLQGGAINFAAASKGEVWTCIFIKNEAAKRVFICNIVSACNVPKAVPCDCNYYIEAL
jgi:hypothetical protein